MKNTLIVKGSELKVGDILHTWWINYRQPKPHRSIIEKIIPMNAQMSPGKYEIVWEVHFKDGMIANACAHHNLTIDRELP
jgi:hypothetical protein